MIGVSPGSGTGVVGEGTNGSEGTSGSSDSGIGVGGDSQSGVGVAGSSVTNTGVEGGSSSSFGVEGTSNLNSGVFGSTSGVVVGTAGVYGVAGGSSSVGGGIAGVWGSSSTNVGVYGNSDSQTGVAGQSGSGDGVYGSSSTGYAGYFSGNVNVTGAITAGTKDFLIDHPLDPANKYLYHASVESSEMKNIYDGNVTTDDQGHAVVQLPEWFEKLNRDFRYQLTVIGQFAQAIVASEIENNEFTILTDRPGVKVSWQVTGVRQDAYAQAHPLVVEVDKAEKERGHYLHPEVFGQPKEEGIGFVQHPNLKQHMEGARKGFDRWKGLPVPPLPTAKTSPLTTIGH